MQGKALMAKPSNPRVLIVYGGNPAKPPKATKAEIVAVKAQRASENAAEPPRDQTAMSERAKKAGMKRRQVRAPDGTVKQIWCFQDSFHAMRLDDSQIKAAEQFCKSYEMAGS